MALAHWVATIEDYAKWIAGILRSCGGTIVKPESGEPTFDEDVYIRQDGQEIHALTVQQHRVDFYDGSYLEFDFEIEDDGSDFFGIPTYSFHYADSNDQLLWRYDLHEGHRDEYGNLPHVHEYSEENRMPSDITDLDDVVRRIRARLWPGSYG